MDNLSGRETDITASTDVGWSAGGSRHPLTLGFRVSCRPSAGPAGCDGENNWDHGGEDSVKPVDTAGAYCCHCVSGHSS